MKVTTLILVLLTASVMSAEPRSIYPTPQELAVYALETGQAPAEAIPPSSKLYRILGLANYGLRSVELVATETIIEQGGRELNPLMQKRGVRLGAGIAAPLVVNYGSELVRTNGHPKWALLIRVVSVGLWSYAVAHNLGEIQ